MDPNKNLKEQLKLAQEILDEPRPNNPGWYDHVRNANRLEELATLVLALDEWLECGGFPPDKWTPFHREEV